MSTLQAKNLVIGMELTKVSIVCSALALNPWNFDELNSRNVFDDSEILQSQSISVLAHFILNMSSNIALHEVVGSLLQTYKMQLKTKNSNLTDQDSQNERFKQYLRKFTFFFNYYYNNSYPNDLPTLSRKKVNTLAVRSLFFMYSI